MSVKRNFETDKIIYYAENSSHRAGVSGLTVARLLQNRYQITVFEKEFTPGGLIRCKRVDGNLYHLCGGHVFNSKRKDVLDWFWSLFDREKEFIKAERNSVVFMEDNSRFLIL